MWYRIARDVMLSEAHADHIIGGLKAAGKPPTGKYPNETEAQTSIRSYKINRPGFLCPADFGTDTSLGEGSGVGQTV